MLSIWRSNIYSFNKYTFPSQSWPKWNVAVPGNASTPLFSYLLLPLTWIYINAVFKSFLFLRPSKTLAFTKLFHPVEPVPIPPDAVIYDLHGRFIVFLFSLATILKDCNVPVPSHSTSNLFRNQTSSPMILYCLLLNPLSSKVVTSPHCYQALHHLPKNDPLQWLYLYFISKILWSHWKLWSIGPTTFSLWRPTSWFHFPPPLPVHFSPTKYKLPEDQNLPFHSYL